MQLGLEVYCLYHICRLTNCRQENPFQSQQSVSLGRSATANAADEGTELSSANGSGSGGGGSYQKTEFVRRFGDPC